MKKIVAFIMITLFTFSSCKKDFVEEDITKKTLIVNSPSDNLVTSVNTVNFWWEPVNGAEKYNIQVVKPDFTNVAQLITDTNVVGTKLNLSLNPGTYQWRIRAFNNGGSTEYQTYNLKIDSTNNLTNQTVIPIAPLNGFVTGNKTITFSWNPLSSATSYSVEISKNGTIINYTNTSSTSYVYTYTLTSAANYTCSWRVRALNGGSISQYNSSQTFTIDLLPPSVVSTPTSPTSNPVIKDTTELRWNRGASDTQYDSLFLYSDAAYTNLVRTTTVSVNKIKVNTISPGNPLPAGTTSVTAIPYWWRLKSVDNVGNTTGFSNALNFQLVQ